MFDTIKRIGGFIRKHPLFFRLLVVAIIFTVLFSNIHPREILQAFKQAKPRYMLIAVLMTIPNILIQIFKWHYILDELEPRPTFRQAFHSVLGGFFLGVASPSRTGELARGIMIPNHSTLRLASLTIVDKGFNQVTVVVIGLLSLSLLLPWPLNIIPLICEGVIFYGIFHISRLRPLFDRLLSKVTHSERVDNALAMFDTLSTRKLWGMLVFSLLFYTLYVSQYYIIMLGFTDVSFQTAVKILPLVYLTNTALPITIGEFGIKEMAAVKFLAPYGVAGNIAFSATLTNNIMTFVIPSMLGGIMVAFFSPKPVSPPSASRTDPVSTPPRRQASS